MNFWQRLESTSTNPRASSRCFSFIHSFSGKMGNNEKEPKQFYNFIELMFVSIRAHPSEDILFTLIGRNLKNFWLLWAIILLWCFIMQTFSDGINCQSFLKDFKKNHLQTQFAHRESGSETEPGDLFINRYSYNKICCTNCKWFVRWDSMRITSEAYHHFRILTFV